MKHPFWLINSVLLVLFLVVSILFFFMPSSLPEKHPLFEKELKPSKAELPKIDLVKIYTNDLFGLYKEPPPRPIELPKEQQLPQPPSLQQPKPAIKPPPTFMAPLEITVRGVMILEDEQENVAIIEDNKTKQATNFYNGDKIQDAQLIRIARNKIILVRSNGQQETLYLDKHDAEIDQLLSQEQDWSSVIKKLDINTYEIDPLQFIKRVHSLAQFIDMLNLSTVYRKGESIGCRIGGLVKNSLGDALGFKMGDIITHINNIPATTTEKRYDIYTMITQLSENKTVTVAITRKTVPLTITYTLRNFEEQKNEDIKKEKNPYDVNEEKQKVLERKYQFAPGAHELKKQEKQAMVNAWPQRNKRNNRDILTKTVTPEIGT